MSYQLFIGNKNYSTWSMRPWILLKQAGIAYATGQIVDLIANGLKNIHVYTMNRPEIIGGIMKNLSEIVK